MGLVDSCLAACGSPRNAAKQPVTLEGIRVQKQDE